MKYLVTGATGAIGRRLLDSLDSAHLLSRNAERAQAAVGPNHSAYTWNAETPPPPEALSGVDCIVHLAGEPVSGSRWTSEKKRRIRSSRIEGTRNLVDGIIASAKPPKVLVAASAVGYYGDRGEEVLTEDAQPDETFMAKLCVDWEAEAKRASTVGVRVVSLRIGIVLDAESGALKQMLPIFRTGLGGTLGSGKQWMSWVHLDDIVGLIKYAAKHDDIAGPVNGVSPEPVTNRSFTKQLGSHLNRPTLFPVPKFAVSLAFGEMADIVFASQRVLPSVALNHGFRFRHETLGAALAACLNTEQPEKK